MRVLLNVLIAALVAADSNTHLKLNYWANETGSGCAWATARNSTFNTCPDEVAGIRYGSANLDSAKCAARFPTRHENHDNGTYSLSPLGSNKCMPVNLVPLTVRLRGNESTQAALIIAAAPKVSSTPLTLQPDPMPMCDTAFICHRPLRQLSHAWVSLSRFVFVFVRGFTDLQNTGRIFTRPSSRHDVLARLSKHAGGS